MDFTKGAITKNIFLFSIPLILGNLFQQLYTLVNSAFVGSYLGVSELAAVGACYPVVFFITSMILGIGTGGSVVVSHHYGAKNFKCIHDIISTFYIFFTVLGLLVCALSIIFADKIFCLLNMQADVRMYAVQYFRIYMAGMFFSVLFHSAVSILRGLGDSVTQLYFLIPANILNAVLSYVFIVRMHWGIESSAVASLISQFIAFAGIFSYLPHKNEYVKLPFKHMVFDKHYFKDIISIGIPTGIQQSVVSLTQILILWLVVGFGTDATAAYSAAMRIESIALLFVLNISQALTSCTGMNIGAGLVQRAKSGFKSSLKIMGGVSVVTMAVFCGLGRQLMGLFTDSEAVISIGTQYLLVSGLFWFVFCHQMMYTAFFRGAGKATVTMVISILSLWIVRYPVSYWLSLKYNTMGIWMGAPVAWLTGVIIYLIVFKSDKWYNKNMVKTFIFAVIMASGLFSCSPKAQQQSTTAVNDDEIQKLHALYPQDAFISPLKIPLTLAGTFAELRGSHFHSGIDIRTNETTGYAVIAPADGYVSRIKIQAYGGGKNLYITHPNGYTTVYMHLSQYSGKIGEFVKQYQYGKHCYTFDYTFTKPQIYVKRGDTIALSGETGMVQGPHLHFEIRDTKTEQPINPLLFGLQVKDSTPPYIQSLALTPYKNSSVEGKQSAKIINISSDTSFHQGDTVECSGNVYFSVLAYDPSFRSTMRNGVWKTELLVGDTVIFSHHVEKFSFNDYGYVDATINYPLYIQSGKRYLCSKQKENGILPFNTYKNKGILCVKTDSIYRITWRFSDLKANKYEYYFFVKGVEDSALVNKEQKKPNTKFFNCKDKNMYTASDGSIFTFPTGALYESIDFSYSKSQGKFSDKHTLHTVYEPVRKKFNIKIKPYKINQNLKSKYLIVKTDSKGRMSSIGGELKSDYVEASAGSFGTYTVWMDTVAPVIKAVNFKTNKTLTSKQKTLKIKISDNLSGINSYNAYLNGQWILTEFDGKRSMLTYNIDKHMKKGKNTLKIVVSDAKGNTKTAVFSVHNSIERATK
ncbi:MAG: MATE family efflux transporter [Bacteroidales bacterium]|nr:MATE family efflux transporter [Bacteroidales bacterium]